MIEITIKDLPPQPYLSVISNDFKLTLTDSQARSLLRALSQVLEEPQVCGIRDMCALYPKNAVAYHDEGSADPAVDAPAEGYPKGAPISHGCCPTCNEARYIAAGFKPPTRHGRT